MSKATELYDDMNFRIYTGKQELDKALSTLHGLVRGITVDGEVTKEEVEELVNWLSLHSHLEKYLPFNEIMPLIRDFVSDGQIDDDEIQDLLWLCMKFSDQEHFFDLLTLSMQELQGIFHGLLADNHLNDNEIKSLNSWLSNNTLLVGTYPYDEVSSVISDILSDGVIDDDERAKLKAFIGEFVDCKVSYNLMQPEIDELKQKYSIVGICAMNPFIDIEDHAFCFTGKSSRATRSQIEQLILENDGTFSNSLTKTTNYLIVGDGGNPCWAFSCYGRKVEKAVELRKSGAKLIIAHESDFWSLFE